MKTGLYARVVFGASAVLFGAIALMWHDAETWQELHRILRLPFGTAIGDVLMVALIAGGIGIVIPRTVRAGALVLIVVTALFSLSCVPTIVGNLRVYGAYASFFEQFSLFCGAVALFAALQTDPRSSAMLGRAARIGMGFCVLSFTLAQIVYLHLTATLVPTWIPPNQTFWAILTTIAFGLAAIAILLNVRARLALRLTTLMLALFGLIVWVPLVVTHPSAHFNWSELALNYLITGAVWLVASSR